MKLGIISMFYARPFTADHLALFPKIKAHGLDFVELLVPEPGELDAMAARAAAKNAGLDIVLAARINPTRDIASPDAKARAAGIAYLKACVDFAVAMGAKIVGGPMAGAPLVFAGRAPTPIDDDMIATRAAWVIAGLREAATHAARHGVTLALEPLNRFETDMLNTTAQGIALVERVGSPALGLLLDTFHMNMEDPSIPAAIRAAGPRMVHFQANENHRGFVGTGHLDWRSIGAALRDVGYAGPVTLEPFRRDEQRLGAPLAQWRAPQRDESDDLARSIAHLNAAWGRA